MSDSCDKSQCSSCPTGSTCNKKPGSMRENTHELNTIKRVIGIVSGKGGVGKSLVTSLMAVQMSKKGYKTGILDADITGPSIPQIFGIDEKAESDQFGIYPRISKSGIKVMSVNLLLDQADQPVIWRGPVISGLVKQFWTDVIWGELDYLYIDMPPGTGDVPLTVFQSIPLDGIIIVTSPQDLVSLIVKKAYNMAKTMNIPILGLVENMSFVKCPDCGKNINIFGKSKLTEPASELGLRVLGHLPVDPELAELCDSGNFDACEKDYLKEASEYIENAFKFFGRDVFI